jgi:hypothetical protein
MVAAAAATQMRPRCCPACSLAWMPASIQYPIPGNFEN